MRNIFKYGLLAMAIAVTSVGVRAQDIPVSGVVKDKSWKTRTGTPSAWSSGSAAAMAEKTVK